MGTLEQRLFCEAPKNLPEITMSTKNEPILQITVKIKSWLEMQQEYGIDEYGDIPDMAGLCETVVQLEWGPPSVQVRGIHLLRWLQRSLRLS